MEHATIADLLVLLHLLFILFVLFGGLAVLRWPWLAWLHLPAAAWGVLVELAGWWCPLTPLEQHYRALAGEGGYSGGFVAHYLWPLIYPDGLTRGIQLLLGLCVLVLNLAIYTWVVRRHRRQSR